MKIKEWIKRNRESAWKLGILENGYNDLRKGRIKYVNNGKYEGKKWFADPFILDFDVDNIYLLVEEYDYDINRGRIAKITVRKSNYTIVDCTIILELPTHLSFPTIYRQGDKIIVCPENYSGGGFYKYEYDQINEKLIRIGTISTDKLVDTTIIELNGVFYMFSTYEPFPNGSLLTIYRSDTFDGPYETYQEVLFNENIGRNAGFIFQHNGDMIRPAQESDYSYGHSIVFQRVRLENGKFEFEKVWRYETTHPTYKLGTHTYNEYKGMGVVDYKGHRNPLVGLTFQVVNNACIALGLKKKVLLK